MRGGGAMLMRAIGTTLSWSCANDDRALGSHRKASRKALAFTGAQSLNLGRQVLRAIDDGARVVTRVRWKNA
jgi:hypothetical protein